jgi:polyphosphate kinase 2 (PPK2 family)
MLEKLNMKKKLSKEEAKPKVERLQERLRVLQRAAYEAKVPVTIVLEGWDAAGKGTLVQRFVEKLDPRGFRLRPTYAPTIEELYRPWMWRFWQRLPPSGEIVVFDRSWYGRVMVDRVEKVIDKSLVGQAFTEIREFERQLTDDGQVLVKVFLHISKKEQRRRFKKCEKDPYQRWKIKPEDWRHHSQYAAYYEAIEEMLEATSTSEGPWTLVPSNDRRTAEVMTLTAVIDAVERRLAALGKLPPKDATVGNLAARAAPKPGAKPAKAPAKAAPSAPAKKKTAPKTNGRAELHA